MKMTIRELQQIASQLALDYTDLLEIEVDFQSVGIGPAVKAILEKTRSQSLDYESIPISFGYRNYPIVSGVSSMISGLPRASFVEVPARNTGIDPCGACHAGQHDQCNSQCVPCTCKCKSNQEPKVKVSEPMTICNHCVSANCQQCLGIEMMRGWKCDCPCNRNRHPFTYGRAIEDFGPCESNTDD